MGGSLFLSLLCGKYQMMLAIAVIGEIGQFEREMLSGQAAALGIVISLRIVGSSLDNISGDADGYISFGSPDIRVLRTIFAVLPVGIGDQVPFFQKASAKTVPQDFAAFPISGFFMVPLTPANVHAMLTSIAKHHAFRRQSRDLMAEVAKYRKQNHQLFRVSTALSSENDLQRLLTIILSETREVVQADAGSIYIRERQGTGKGFTSTLRFKVSQNDSVDVGAIIEEFTVAINENTIAGYVAATGGTLNIPDVYAIDSAAPYKFGLSFDRHFHYHVKSMLTVPLKNMAGMVVGVMQLMNKEVRRELTITDTTINDSNIEPFTHADEDLAGSIGSIAAVSIERAQLYEDIQQLFEGFLQSSIAAVDERDRVTSGHSRRVMGYALAFIEAINAQNDGPFAKEHFNDSRRRQFKFSALLHDIGKIGVPEGILTKVDRLTKGDLAALLSRLDFVRYKLVTGGAAPDAASWRSVEEVESDRVFIERINSSGYVNDEDLARLAGLRQKTYADASGTLCQLFNDFEWESLSIRNGNLTAKERETINSHALATHRILSKIPWTHELENIPDIAAHHHEKLDGSGYPDGLKGDQICLESRILCVVDIYEALVAQDRPYKPAMLPEKALAILRTEACKGYLDSQVVEFFVDKEIWKTFLGQLPAAQC
jgi:HD-GYP domain-containing protein (c-di-GMP phosphodiesterase class II)